MLKQFNIICPKCKLIPPLILKVEHSLSKYYPVIKIKCDCFPYLISLTSLNELINLKSFSDIQTVNEIKLNEFLEISQYKVKRDLINDLKSLIINQQVMYQQLKNKLNEISIVLEKVENEINDLYNWDKNFNKELENFLPKLFDDFCTSKNTKFTNSMSNFAHFKLDSLNQMTENLLKISPNFDNILHILKSIKSSLSSLREKSSFSYLDLPINIKSNEIIHNFKLQTNIKFNHKQNKFLKVYKFRNYHGSTIESVCLLKNGDFASCSTDRTIKIWKLGESVPYINMQGHNNSILSIIELSNGLLSTGSSDHTIGIWNLQNRTREKILTGHSGSVIQVIQIKNSKIVSCSSDQTIRVWDMLQDYSSFELIGHKQSVQRVFELNNGMIISCSLDAHVRLWNIYSRKCVKKFKFDYSLISMDLINQNEVLLLNGIHKIIILNLNKSEITYDIKHLKPVYSLGHTNDGKIICGYSNGNVSIYNYKNDIEETILKSHDDTIIFVKLFHNNYLCTSSWDGSFNIWV